MTYISVICYLMFMTSEAFTRSYNIFRIIIQTFLENLWHYLIDVGICQEIPFQLIPSTYKRLVYGVFNIKLSKGLSDYINLIKSFHLWPLYCESRIFFQRLYFSPKHIYRWDDNFAILNFHYVKLFSYFINLIILCSWVRDLAKLR